MYTKGISLNPVKMLASGEWWSLIDLVYNKHPTSSHTEPVLKSQFTCGEFLILRSDLSR